MRKLWQYVVNGVLYGFLLWLLYDSTVVEWDPWFAFVVAFLVVLALVVSCIPSLSVSSLSPGEYPFED